MKRKLYGKILGVVIIILFVGVSVSFAYDNNNLDEQTYKNTKSETFDNFIEVFTKVDAQVYGFKLKGLGFLFHIELWGVDETIVLIGYRYPIFPISESAFSVWTDHAIIHNFIGRWEQVTVDTYSVKGVALGNIEWS